MKTITDPVWRTSCGLVLLGALFAVRHASAQAVAGDLAQTSAPVQSVQISALRNAEWDSYRHAYKATSGFATYVASRPLIQAHMQLRPQVPEASFDGLKVSLSGDKTKLELPVDAIGRVTVPLIKQAYDEDAVLRLNRQQGQFFFSGRYSIKEREDGRYATAELHSACEQLISAQRESGYRMRLIGKKCAGIKFVYPADKTDAAVVLETGPTSTPIKAVDAHPFEDQSMGMYKVAIYRFADWPQAGTIVTAERPLAIGTLYE